MYWAYYLNYLFCAAKIASLRNKSIVRLAGAAKNLRLLLLNHHHFTQVIIFCVLQNSNGLFKGSLKKSAISSCSRTDSLKRSCWGVKTHYFFSIFTRTYFYDTWKMQPKLDVKHHLTFWSHTKMDINKKLVHWAGTNKWKFTICETTGSKFNDFHHCGHESNIKKNILVRCEQAVMCTYILGTDGTYIFLCMNVSTVQNCIPGHDDF